MGTDFRSQVIVILGSSGFLGSKISKLFGQKTEVLASVKSFPSLLRDPNDRIVEISTLKDAKSFLVINCSSGRLQNFEKSNESNFEFPLSVLRNILELRVPLSWVQFDSYTQYSLDKVHDKNYVQTKNRLNQQIDAYYSKKLIVNLRRIVLPHLYGSGDKKERFLPKMFGKILLGEEIVIQSPSEALPIIDVNDCARVILEIVTGSHDYRENNTRDILTIYPTEVTNIYEFLIDFKTFSQSNSFISKGEELPNVFIEGWQASEQPLYFDSKLIRTSRHKTFQEIIAEMKGSV